MTDFSLIERRENTENKTVKACEGETIMKKKIISACMAFAVLISSLPIGSFAAEDTAKNFYIKKNGNKTPILSSDLALIQKYGALYIDTNYQGLGIGSSFKNIFEQWAIENGATQYVIGVLKDNVKARRVYESWGGKLSEVEEDFVKLGVGYSEVFYTYDLQKELKKHM